MAQSWPTSGEISPNAHVVVRPAVPWGRYATFGIGMIVFMTLAAACMLLIKDPLQRNTVLCTFLGFVAFIVAGGLRLLALSCFSFVELDVENLVVGNSLGVRRHIDRSRVARIQAASFDLTIRTSFTFSYFLFLDSNGRTVLKLASRWWPEAGIAAIGQALAVPVSSTTEVLDGPAYRHTYPGSIPWVVAHPREFCYLVGLGILPAVLVVFWLLSVIQGSG